MALVVAKCSSNKAKFAMRFKEISPGCWSTDWSFPVGEQSSLNEENYQDPSTRQIEGAFQIDPGYPGCPHCQAKSFYRCTCGKQACWDGKNITITCPSCNQTSNLLVGGLRSVDSKSDG